MKLTALVLSEETRSGVKNNKAWQMTTITLMDMGEKPRCKTPLEITLGDDDKDLLGTLEGETIMVDILSLEAGFKGGINARARIIREGAVTSQARPPVVVPLAA